MNIYQKKTRWKYLLAIAGLLILAVSTLYTNYLARELTKEEQNKVRLWVIAFEELAAMPMDSDCSATLHVEVTSSNFHIPALVVDEDGEILIAQNFSNIDPKNPNTPELKKELEFIKTNGPDPIPLVTDDFTQYVYYKESTLLQTLSYFPIIQVLLVTAFILIGYWLFSSARKSEQELVWVGMAKETAHQLGTPISAIIAWLDFMKDDQLSLEDRMNVINEMETDVNKLELIADRFSKIGSTPVLEKQRIKPLLDEIADYFEKRKPEDVEIEVVGDSNAEIKFNAHLLTWVVENLIRNSLDALDKGVGRIELEVIDQSNKLMVLVKDSGHGIPSNMHKSIFQPGISTKKRGWGLGLSLAKRIIENYHQGKIYVKSSQAEVQTVFAIELPK